MTTDSRNYPPSAVAVLKRLHSLDYLRQVLVAYGAVVARLDTLAEEHPGMYAYKCKADAVFHMGHALASFFPVHSGPVMCSLDSRGCIALEDGSMTLCLDGYAGKDQPFHEVFAVPGPWDSDLAREWVAKDGSPEYVRDHAVMDAGVGHLHRIPGADGLVQHLVAVLSHVCAPESGATAGRIYLDRDALDRDGGAGALALEEALEDLDTATAPEPRPVALNVDLSQVSSPEDLDALVEWAANGGVN